MDDEAIINSVQKTRKIVIVDEDYPRCSIASDISALVAEQAFDYLDAPPRRVTPPHTSVPYSMPLEALYLPTKEKVVAAAKEVLPLVTAAEGATVYKGRRDSTAVGLGVRPVWNMGVRA